MRDGLVLSQAHIYLIYWGGAWENGASPSSDQVTAAVSSILGSGYLEGLSQYGAATTATLTGEYTTASSEPPPAFTESDIVELLFDLIEAETIPDPASDPDLLYFVLLPPGVPSVRSDVVGEHSYFIRIDMADAPQPGGLTLGNVHYGWVTNDGTIDSVTSIFSHELVEAITDPEGNGVTGEPGSCQNDGWCELGDVCGQTDKVAGVRVQAYWSQQAGQCVIGEHDVLAEPVVDKAAGLDSTPNGSGGTVDTKSAESFRVPSTTEAVSQKTVAITSATRPPTANGGRRTPSSSFGRWRTEFTAALMGAAPILPMVAVVATVTAYLLPVGNMAGIGAPSSVFVSGLVATLIVWLFLGLAARRLASAESGNAEEYGQLRIRVEQLRAHLAGTSVLPAPRDASDASAIARTEALKLLGLLDAALIDVGLPWILGIAYIHAWVALHRAEEALIRLESIEAAIGEGLYDELRLEGSQIANLDELLSKVRRAVSTLSNQAGHLYLAKEDLASAVSDPPKETADPEATARTTLIVVRRTLNEYRDELWSGIVRARNQLMKTHFIAGLGTYLLLLVLLLDRADRAIVVAASVFFLFGGLVGFVARLRDEAVSDKGLEDFGLSTARLLTAPLLSGLAAIFGVLLVGLAHVKIGDFALGPSPAPGSSFPALRDIFSLGRNPAGFMAAALFGLTPGLLIGYLQSQTSKLNDAIKSSQPSGGS